MADTLFGQDLRDEIIRSSQTHGLDPRVPLAVAPHEGGFDGAVGDHGTSFGPFQLHAGGRLPAEIWAKGPSFSRQWANSQAGIDYAIAGMKEVVGDLQGVAAVTQVVNRFEVPALKYRSGEAAKAVATYLVLPPSVDASSSAPTAAPATVQNTPPAGQEPAYAPYPRLDMSPPPAAIHPQPVDTGPIYSPPVNTPAFVPPSTLGLPGGGPQIPGGGARIPGTNPWQQLAALTNPSPETQRLIQMAGGSPVNTAN